MKSHLSLALDGFIAPTTSLVVGRWILLVLFGYGVMATAQPVPAADCIPPPSGLVGWWPGETNANDLAAGHHGILTTEFLGPVLLSPGKVGNAFDFRGTNFVEIPSIPLGNFTLELWVNQRTRGAFGDTFGSVLVSDEVCGVVNDWHTGVLPDGRIVMRIAGNGTLGTGSVFISSNAIPLHTFTHVAVTRSTNDGQVVIYLNGAVDSTHTSVNNEVLGVSDPTCDTGIHQNLIGIGNLRRGAVLAGNLVAFDGLIDEVSLYGRVLSTSELEAIYSAGNAGKCPPPPSTSQNLINVDFGYGTSSSKVGFAATGHTVADYWNFYTRDDGSGGYRTFGAVSNLRFADETVSSVGLTVANAPGAWGNGSSDPMYQINIYPFDGGNITVTVTNLPVGQYDFYLYNQEGNYQVSVGGMDYGIKTTSDPANTSPPVWQEGNQYVVFRNVQVASAEQAVTITVRPGVGGLALISGMQIATVSTTAPPICVTAPSGLVSWWRAEHSAQDAAGGNHGALQNGAAIVAGQVGQAFSLDGVDDVVTVPDAPNLRFGPTSPMTVDLWVYRTSNNPGQHLIGKRDSCTGSSTEGTFQIFLDMNTGAGLGFGPPGGACACSGQNLPLNTWTHLAGTFDGTTLRLFINGQLAATTPGSLGPANTAPLKIGDSGTCGADYGAAFGGLIDEVSIYNRALSTDEIQAIVNAGSAGKCPPPPPTSQKLLNVDFGIGTSSSKVGFAAIGQMAADYWNLYTRDDGSGGYRTFGAVSNLKFADGAVSSVGLTVANAPGAWGNGSSDAMYQMNIYPFDGGNITVTVTNLPMGQYDFYLYNQEGNYQVTVGGTDYGIKTTSDPVIANPPVWQEGKQYAVFRNVQVASAEQAVTITVRPGIGGLALISGMQIATVSTTPPCTPTPSGLLSWWRAEGNALDSTDGNNGTLQNGAAIVPGKVGQTFSFDGTGEVVVPTSASLNVQSVTFEGWVNPSVVDSDVDTILNKENDPAVTSSDISYEIGIRGAVNAGVGSIPVGHLAFFLGGIAGLPDEYGGGWVDGGAEVPVNHWSHCALAFDGTTVRVYVNGTLTRTIGGLSGTMTSTTGPFKIGSRSSSLVSSRPELRFNGLIDEVSIYNRALTTSEIQAIYNAAIAGKCPPPPPHSQNLINVDFGYGTSSSKVGFAATGQTPNDYWNFYTRDDGSGGYRTFGGMDNLKFANGDVSSVGLTVANAPGAWGNGSSDAMYQINVYPFDGGNITVTVTNLPMGHYDFYLYNQQGNYQVTVGGTDFGIKTTSDPTISNPPVWQEGVQYAVFRNVLVASVGQAVTITVRPGVGGLALISGMQIATDSTTPPPSCVPATSGLVSWWQAESNALDSTDGNNGTLQNGAAIVAGKVGQAFSLDGVDDVVTVPDAPNLRFGPTSPMTVDMWVFRTSSSPGQHLIGKRDSCTGSSTEGTFQMFLDMNTGAGLGFGPPGGACACSGQDLPLNTWTHLAGTFDGTILRLFINGQLAATTTGSLGPANTAPLKIGDSGSCGAFYRQAFGGLMDEVSLYNRALSTNEIQAIYNAGTAGKCEGSSPIAMPDAFSTSTNTPASFNARKLLLNDIEPHGLALSVTGVSSNSALGGTVDLIAGRVHYTPPPGFQGNDQFTYSITNEQGRAASSTVTATIGSGGQVGLNITYGPVIEGNEFIVRFAGIPGLTYTIEATPSLEGGWTKVTNITAPTTNTGLGIGVFEFREPLTGAEARYYRTIHPPY